MAGKNQIEASKLAPLSERLDNLDAQEAEQAKSTDKAQSPLTAGELEKMEQMTKQELIALIKRVSGAIWGIALATKEERLEAAKLKLWNAGLTQPDIFKALPALREVMDRESGKPAQSIAMTVEDKGLGKLSDARLLRLESELARITGSEAVVILPEPVKLDND